MAFLDNSGDILLDAVLTDTGRMRMARGDFKIVKFAFGDDEINYALFEANHTSGSAYQDLKILQTPVFEAFTNNTSVMKSKLMTIGRTNILYLPKILVNTYQSPTAADTFSPGTHIVIANRSLRETLQTGNAKESTGYMFGDGEAAAPRNTIVLDQGIVDADEDQTIASAIDPDLRETQYIIKVDHRIARVAAGGLAPLQGQVITNEPRTGRATPIFIDDDHIAHYAFGSADVEYVQPLGIAGTTEVSQWTPELVHAGPLGTRLGFRLEASEAAKTSTSLYTKLGKTATLSVKSAAGANTTNCDYIDTIVRVTGVTTGYSVDIPVRFVRKT